MLAHHPPQCLQPTLPHPTPPPPPAPHATPLTMIVFMGMKIIGKMAEK
jgi:hypothetical protein